MADTDILYLNIAGTEIVVLDTSKVATDLLENRSSIYSGRLVVDSIQLRRILKPSSRPRMPMVQELMGWDFNAAFMDYGACRSYTQTFTARTDLKLTCCGSGPFWLVKGPTLLRYLDYQYTVTGASIERCFTIHYAQSPPKNSILTSRKRRTICYRDSSMTRIPTR
jgi:hypothetical protein